jgi:hypothetical protein
MCRYLFARRIYLPIVMSLPSSLYIILSALRTGIVCTYCRRKSFLCLVLLFTHRNQAEQAVQATDLESGCVVASRDVQLVQGIDPRRSRRLVLV